MSRTFTLTIPEDLAQRLELKVAAFEEAEVVILPDGRMAKTTKRKYQGENPLHEWLMDGVAANLLAADPDYFKTPSWLEERFQLMQMQQQQEMREAALAKLKGAQ